MWWDVWVCVCGCVVLWLCAWSCACRTLVVIQWFGSGRWETAVASSLLYLVSLVSLVSLCAAQLMRYPFLPDFHAATLVKSGSSLRDAM